MSDLFGRYAWNKREQFDQGTLALPGIFLDAQDPLIRENNNAVLDAVTILSPSMILDTRVALTRYIEEARRGVYTDSMPQASDSHPRSPTRASIQSLHG